MRLNSPNEHVCFLLLSANDGSPVTGATVSVSRTANGSIQTPGQGFVTEQGNGEYTYNPSQGETSSYQISFLFSAPGAIPVLVNIYTTDYANYKADTTELAKESTLDDVPKKGDQTWTVGGDTQTVNVAQV